MKTHLALLKGINVGGKHLVKMDTLRKTFEHLQYQSVNTYIQSGNVVFRTFEKEPSLLSEEIELQMLADFGFKVKVQVWTLLSFRQIIADNPFKNDPSKKEAFIYITYFATQPGRFDIKQLVNKKSGSEEFFITDNAFYLYCPDGYSKTKLTNKFIESQLKVEATTRNWKTTLALKALAKQLSTH